MQIGLKGRFLFALAAILVLTAIATGGGAVNADTGSAVLDSFDGDPTGPKVTGAPWDITTNASGSLEVVEFPDSANKSLRATNSDTGTTQKTQVSVKRKFDAMTGKVYFETKLMFKDIANTNLGNFNVCLWGYTSGTTSPKTAVQFQRFSSGSFGYMLYSNSENKELSYYMPSNTFIFPEDEWVTLKTIVDTETQKATLSITCDSLKAYNGTVDPQCSLDKASGTCTVSDINFYTDGMQFDYFNQYSFALNKYTCEYNFDYFKVTSDDVVAPTVPENLVETGKTESTVSMAWDASTDNVGVAGYEVYQDGQLIATVTETSYTATGLDAGKQYTFTVRAKDGQGNVSDYSSGLTVITNAGANSIILDSFDDDPTGPKSSDDFWNIETKYESTLEVVEFPDSGNKSLRARDTDFDTNDQYRSSVSAKRNFAPMTGKIFLETKVMYKEVNHADAGNFEICLWGGEPIERAVYMVRYSGGHFGYTLMENDEEIFYYMPSEQFIFPKDEWVTIKMMVDTETKKANLSMSCDSLKNYNGPVDPQCSLDKASGTCTVTGIPLHAENTVFNSIYQYSFSLDKYTSEYNFDYFKVANVDEEAPATPSNLVETGKTATTVSMAWDASSDNVGVAGYEVYQDGVLIATVTETNYTATGLATGKQYTFTVRARDDQGNVSSDSSGLIVTTILDRSLLINKCATAEEMLTAASQGQEGIQDGMYVVDTLETIISSLQKAIEDAQAVIDNAESTADDVDTSIKALDDAIDRNNKGLITAATGDLDDNGGISVGDLGIAAGLFGKEQVDDDWQSAVKADFNQNKKIEASDLEFLSKRILIKN